MTGLGLAGAGLGGVALAAPAFHDLDELTSSHSAQAKRAWWVKEADEPTVEIDWDLMHRDVSQTCQSSALHARYHGWEGWEAKRRSNSASDNIGLDLTVSDKPGYKLRDMALYDANGASGSVSYSRDSAGHLIVGRGKTPEERGVPRWTGTPEEAAKMLRAFMVYAGAANIGVSELDEHHRKIVCLTGQNVSHKSYFPWAPVNKWPAPSTVTEPIEFDANDNVYRMDPTTRTNYIPSSIPIYDVVYSVPQDAELNLRRPTPFGQAAQTRYRLRTNIQYMTFTFLKGLGYWADSLPYRGYPDQASAVLSGLSETSRHTLMSISPEFGAFMGTFTFVTDLPLAHTKPIDAGIWRFCDSCGICADVCPSGSIEPKGGREKSWEPTASSVVPKHPPLPGWKAEAEYHKVGCKRYWTDMISCCEFIMSTESCFRCWGSCVFNGANEAMGHNVVRATASSTGLLNSFFANMHGIFGYGLKEGDAIEEWWDMSLPSYGWDTSKLANKKY